MENDYKKLQKRLSKKSFEKKLRESSNISHTRVITYHSPTSYLKIVSELPCHDR